MSDVAVLARLVLGGVFVAAGCSKLTASGQQAFARGAAGLGVPPRLAAPVPWIEVVLGAALVAGVGVRVAALLACALLAAFTGAIARVLRHGERPDCGCFGAASARPVGVTSVVRNAGLAVLAAVAAVEGAWAAPWGGEPVAVVLVASGAIAIVALLTTLRDLVAR